MYSGFVEVSVKFAEPKAVLEFILDYTPTSVEIEEPEKLKLDASVFTGILNDFSNYILGAQGEIRALRAHIHHMQSGTKKK